MRVCVRVCNSVSYALDDIGKYINAFRTHQNIFIVLTSDVFCRKYAVNKCVSYKQIKYVLYRSVAHE